MTCECCGATEVDDVALVLIEEGVMRFRDALVEKREQVEAAWAEAFAKSDEALAAAQRARGA